MRQRVIYQFLKIHQVHALWTYHPALIIGRGGAADPMRGLAIFGLILGFIGYVHFFPPGIGQESGRETGGDGLGGNSCGHSGAITAETIAATAAMRQAAC